LVGNHPEKTIAKRERFRINHPDYQENKRKEYKKRIDAYNHVYNVNNKDKRSAENKVKKSLLRANCEICGSSENLVRHHPDYSEPLFYVTLCSSCHNYVHNGVAKP